MLSGMLGGSDGVGWGLPWVDRHTMRQMRCDALGRDRLGLRSSLIPWGYIYVHYVYLRVFAWWLKRKVFFFFLTSHGSDSQDPPTK